MAIPRSLMIDVVLKLVEIAVDVVVTSRAASWVVHTGAASMGPFLGLSLLLVLVEIVRI